MTRARGVFRLPARRAGGTALAAVLAPLLLAAPVRGQPWGREMARAPLEGMRSAYPLGENEPLFTDPWTNAPRRGAAARGARLPIYAARRSAGCAGAWLMVGPLAWICSTRATPSPLLPDPPEQAVGFTDGLPFRYYFANEDGAFGYRDLDTAEYGVPDATIEPGFALAVRRIEERHPGDPFGLTTKDVWVPMRDLRPAQSFLFRGEELSGSLDVAWVYEDTADVHVSPGGAVSIREARFRFAVLKVLDIEQRRGRRWFRIGEEQWVSDAEVRAPSQAPLPAGLQRGERWLDVDRGNQILTAYEGERAVFATLVSTGRGRDGTEEATPRGEFRIWAKLRSSDMDNLEAEEASRYYAIQDVPWVMYFHEGYGLHGTFWHQSFGEVRSHGCINLAPLDAQRIFDWTNPRVPQGWSAALPTPYDPGTLVRVR